MIVAIVVGGTAILAFFARREYRRLIDSCKDSYEVAVGGDALSCLEPPHWAAFNVFIGFLLFLELCVVVWAVAIGVWWKKKCAAKAAPRV